MIYDKRQWKNKEYSIKTEYVYDYPNGNFETTLNKLDKDGNIERQLVYFSTKSPSQSRYMHEHLFKEYQKYIELYDNNS